MEIKTWWARLGCIRHTGANSEKETARDEEIDELRAAIERQKEDVLKLHRDLAAEKLRADQGWHRYEAANSRKNELEAERANWAHEISALKEQQADRVTKDASQLTTQELSDPEYMKAYIEGSNESFAEAMREIVRLRVELFEVSQPAIQAKDTNPLCYVRQSDIDSPIGSAIWAYRMAGGEWTVPVHVSTKDQPQ